MSRKARRAARPYQYTRHTWTVDDDGLAPGHFVVYRYRQPVGHLYIDPRAVPLGLVAIREVVADMMLAASNPRIADELYAQSLGLDDDDRDGR